MAEDNGQANGHAKSGWGGARKNAGRPKGRKSTSTLKREEIRHRAAARSLDPVDFMLLEMRNRKNPKPMRLELARWVAPYIKPRLASVAVMKSIKAMTDEELEWAIADAQKPSPRPPGWRPQVIRGNR